MSSRGDEEQDSTAAVVRRARVLAPSDVVEKKLRALIERNDRGELHDCVESSQERRGVQDSAAAMIREDAPDDIGQLRTSMQRDERDEQGPQNQGGDKDEFVSNKTSMNDRIARDRAHTALFGEPKEPAHVGRFKLLAFLGKGGMGQVFAAFDDQLERRVAIKVLSREIDDRSRALMKREATAMARLTHPNVVHVYEVGEAAGDLYIAMEYVKGQTLAAWQRDRTWQQLLDAYTQAGQGLAAAHAVQMVHRDFKPDNVMVETTESGKPRVRVLDFGLARLGNGLRAESEAMMSDPPADSQPGVRLTVTGLVVGTVAYMAPEQFLSADVDSSADQFSYCIALWEALYGKRPFEGETFDQLAANVTGGKRAPRPSTPKIPTWLAHAMERGLEADPRDRWPSMAALLDVLSRRPQRRRVAWAGVAALGGLTAIVGARWAMERAELCSGAHDKLSGVWDDARRQAVQSSIVGVEASFANAVWDRIGAQLGDYAEDWARMYTETCEATQLRGEQSEEVMDLRMACLDGAKVQLNAATGVLADADLELVTNAHKVVADLKALSRCADIEALQAGMEPPMDAETEPVARIRERLAEASALRKAGQYDKANAVLEIADEVLGTVSYGPVKTEAALLRGGLLDDLGDYKASESALRDALESGLEWKQWSAASRAASALIGVVGEKLGEPERAMQLVEVARGIATHDNDAPFRSNLAIVLAKQGKFEEADKEHRAALAVREEALGPDHPDVARSRSSLANVLMDQGKFEEADKELRAALASLEKALGPDHPSVAHSRNNLAIVLARQGKFEEADKELRAALALREKALGPDHPDVATSRSNLANVLAKHGKFEEAEKNHRAALALREKALGPDHPDVANSRNNLAAVLRKQGKFEEADKELRAAIALLEKALGPDHPAVANSRNNLAIVLAKQGKSEEAEKELRAALALREKALGPDHPDVANSRNNLAAALMDQGKFEEAEKEHRAALALLGKALGPDHPNVATSRSNLATVLMEQGKFEEAENEERAALALGEKALGPDHPDVALMRQYLGKFLFERGQNLDEARELLELAWRVHDSPTTPPGWRADTAFILAQLLWDTKADRPRARELAQTALKSYEGSESDTENMIRAKVEKWLRTHRPRAGAVRRRAQHL